LFFSANDVSNPTVFLEGSNEIFYWNMRSGKLSLSHINHGAKNINIIGNEVLQDSIKVQVSREPYKQINVKLSASWIQHAFGIIDIYPMIAAKFSANLVNSFTNIKTGIENLCKTSGKSGYTLIRCNMKEINPNATGILNSYPLISPDCYLQEDESSLKKKVNFKRFYFNGELIFSWNYKQKRMETVNVKVINKKSKYGREKNLFLRLNAVQIPKNLPIWNHFTYYGHSETVLHNGNIFECQGAHVSKKEFEEGKWKLIKKIPDALGDDSCGSFFATDRGKNAIRYALQKAIALMNYSSRYVAIEFCVEAKNFIFATINDQITIHDARFQKNLIVGKIIKTQLIANTTQKIMKITIGCCVDDFGESYFEKLKTQKIEILSDDSKINPADIVTNIDIKNSPEEQVICLSQAIAKNVSELKNILKKQATKIKISLHPLNTTRVITREINLPDLDL
ncbi:MAG: hypothetical protein LBS23_02775, partial [Holosporaceae bacterium]|jgi:hypothetical protein|nr:hypothetical protein [Holosporaceae bacterium]